MRKNRNLNPDKYLKRWRTPSEKHVRESGANMPAEAFSRRGPDEVNNWWAQKYLICKIYLQTGTIVMLSLHPVAEEPMVRGGGGQDAPQVIRLKGAPPNQISRNATWLRTIFTQPSVSWNGIYLVKNTHHPRCNGAYITYQLFQP